MAVNTHGINIDLISLEKASKETENYGDYGPRYNEIFFDKSSGEVWTRFQYDLGRNDRTVYHDPNVLKVCNTSHHLTAQHIADLIEILIKEA